MQSETRVAGVKSGATGRPKIAIAISLLVALVTTSPQSVHAADRFVDGNGGSDAGNNCLSAASPCASVGHAVDVAVVGDTVRIDDAVYTETLVIDKALALRGQSRPGTVIQAASIRGQATSRTITVVSGVDLELADLTVRHGNSSAGGGGLLSDAGDLLIERVKFVGNDAEGQGAGLSAGGADSIIVMQDVRFSDNGSSSTETGGGCFLGRNFSATDVTLDRVVFENNTAQSGGGLRLFNSESVLNDVAFIANAATGSDGGALFYEGSNSVESTLDLENPEFVGNEAAGNGGALYSRFETPYLIVNGLFSGNFAGNLGGGIYNQSGSPRILTNVTLSGNRATVRGGAIARPLETELQNTIIWNNQDQSGVGTESASLSDFLSNDVQGVNHSLIQSFPANEFPGTGNFDGTLPASNPLFRNAANPAGAPGLAGNLRLLQESPVRDQGNNAFVAGIDTDLDGEARIFGGIVDLGPYEGTDLIFADGFEDSDF